MAPVAGGIDWVAVQAAIHAWVVAGSGLTADKVVWGEQYAPRPAAPAIVMRIHVISTIGTDWLNVATKPLTFSPITITSVDPIGNTLTKVAHGLLTGDGPVRLTTTGTLPGNLNLTTDYWVIKVDADSFKLASSYAHTGGGNISNPVTPIDILDTGTGVHTLSATATTTRGGQEIQHLARGLRDVTVVLECYTGTGVGASMAQAILNRLVSRSVFPSQEDILVGAKIGLIDISRALVIPSRIDVVIFEPRARMELTLCIASEDSENTTYIEHVKITDQITGTTKVVPP